MSFILGIDVGGTGIKSALVDVENGLLVSDRVKYPTPKNVTPETMKPIIKKIVNDLEYDGNQIGVGFPSIVRNEICCSANNISNQWIGTNLIKYFSDASERKAFVINDADAAGLSELYFGEAKEVKGTCILLTLGTGIGSAMYNDGVMLRNVELGSLKFKGDLAEKFVSNKIRKERDLGWKEWTSLLNEYLDHVNAIFSPQLIILGGGVSKKFDSFSKHLICECKVVPAKMFNNAGIVGAALSTSIR